MQERAESRSQPLLASPVLAWGSCVIVLILLIGFAVSRASILDRLQETRRELAVTQTRYVDARQRAEGLEATVNRLDSQVAALSTSVKSCQTAIQNYRQGFAAVGQMARAINRGYYILASYHYERAKTLLEEADSAAWRCSTEAAVA
jgi:septal ring factor EnvC (AmiA/AmiB activator)